MNDKTLLNGECFFKLSGDYVSQNMLDQWRTNKVIRNPTIYVSPYLVATPKGYTKHYYAESERVSSRIGCGLDSVNRFLRNLSEFLDSSLVSDVPLWTEEYPKEPFDEKCAMNLEHLQPALECAGPILEVVDECLTILHKYGGIPNHEYEPDCYWYYPDHLGSSSWVTYTNGEAVQHLHYLPWGEDMVNQQLSGFGSMYTFSAKEKDEETGYSVTSLRSVFSLRLGKSKQACFCSRSLRRFGARYYNSDLSIWLRVDPMSDKYPSLSPYAYCANNPVKLVDPDGRWIPGLDDDGNVIVTMEDGDDYNSFKAFMGKDYCDEELQCLYGTLQNGKINLTKEYGGIFQQMTDAINSDYTTGVNCWGTAISILDNNKIDPDYRFGRNPITSKMNADIILRMTGYSVPQSETGVGSTLIRFSNDNNPTWYGSTDHFATYMGMDSKGNQYCFTKNGWGNNWDIQKIDDFHCPENGTKIEIYGSPAPLGNDESPYYNKR